MHIRKVREVLPQDGKHAPIKNRILPHEGIRLRYDYYVQFGNRARLGARTEFEISQRSQKGGGEAGRATDCRLGWMSWLFVWLFVYEPQSTLTFRWAFPFKKLLELAPAPHDRAGISTNQRKEVHRALLSLSLVRDGPQSLIYYFTEVGLLLPLFRQTLLALLSPGFDAAVICPSILGRSSRPIRFYVVLCTFID